MGTQSNGLTTGNSLFLLERDKHFKTIKAFQNMLASVKNQSGTRSFSYLKGNQSARISDLKNAVKNPTRTSRLQSSRMFRQSNDDIRSVYTKKEERQQSIPPKKTEDMPFQRASEKELLAV